MEVINYNIKRFVAFSGGAFFFLFLIIHNIWEQILSLSKLVFDSPGLYNFREDNYAKIECTKSVEHVSIELGQLPLVINDTVDYLLTSDLRANEIYLECCIINYADVNSLELDYTLSFNNPNMKHEYFYLFLNSLNDNPNMSFDNAGFWINKPLDNQLSIKCSGIKPVNSINGLHTKVKITQIR